MPKSRVEEFNEIKQKINKKTTPYHHNNPYLGGHKIHNFDTPLSSLLYMYIYLLIVCLIYAKQ